MAGGGYVKWGHSSNTRSLDGARYSLGERSAYTRSVSAATEGSAVETQRSG